MDAISSGGFVSEFQGVRFHDRRLYPRFAQILERLALGAGLPFSTLFPGRKDREAFFRFVGNERIGPGSLLGPHFEKTAARIRAAGKECLVIHDSSTFEPVREAAGDDMGYLRDKARGFIGHFSLAAPMSGPKRTLGTMCIQLVVREGAPKKLTDHQRRMAQDKESARWIEGIEEADARATAAGASAVHVLDREGDAYPLLATLVGSGKRFVIRQAYDRRVAAGGPEQKLLSALSGLDDEFLREVTLSKREGSRRAPSLRKKFPERAVRKARLHVRAGTVSILRPHHAPAGLPESVSINAVQVFEVGTPADTEPVAWTLLTTEPIASPADLGRVVDIYVRRWTIEEFFKALKTGCGYAFRQFETLHAFLNLLALNVPIAHELLALRAAAREAPDEKPTTPILSAQQLAVLRVFQADAKIGPHPTNREILLCIAGLAGHSQYNGEPGWKKIGEGYQRLLAYETGWAAAKQAH